MTAGSSPTSGMTVTAVPSDPLAKRFQTPIEKCEVEDKKRLAEYRFHWQKWMQWYSHGTSELHSVESQIHQMVFDDLTYRSIVSVRESVPADVAVSSRSSTLAYLLDRGYFFTQILAIQKLLDNRDDVISIRRLLKDVRRHRKLITREVYVAGDGLPYDYNKWSGTIDKTDPMVQIYGIDAPGLHDFATSKYLHETFDLLVGKQPSSRTKKDLIPDSIFQALESWISGSDAQEITNIRHNFIAHAASSIRLGSLQFKALTFSQIDNVQRALVRVERALMDHILSIRIARNVVPLPPLGIFSGLDLPYAPSEQQVKMHQCWDELQDDRNGWSKDVLKHLANGHSQNPTS
jgi:hypothetical protein